MIVNDFVLDYVAICDSRGEVLDFTDFVDLWNTADALARESFPEGPTTLNLVDRMLRSRNLTTSAFGAQRDGRDAGRILTTLKRETIHARDYMDILFPKP